MKKEIDPRYADEYKKSLASRDERYRRLAAMTDGEIDSSDIPETEDWKKMKRGLPFEVSGNNTKVRAG